MKIYNNIYFKQILSWNKKKRNGVMKLIRERINNIGNMAVKE